MACSEGQAAPSAGGAATAGIPALEARDMRNRIKLPKGIILRINTGEGVSITGPSGSGKSLLSGIIAGLDNPTSGQVLIDGIDSMYMGESHLAKVGNQP